ncbi:MULTISPECIES: GNAT family N-acetyltransferase [Staphylococcus]|uniref:N-acetyltransferase n=1 Tax=Staphylococcus chromogenes TaxID=46126 RepID=A0AAE5W8E7_STACR|nr:MULTISPECIES: GNAT family N-acetyltransferase [Staphylococcus]MBP0046903.1 GNAT family N-acetyltransferase [Staphylococcus chromogenes]MCE4971596.1 GNAT family N-acetyltransferase [Staphylococcus chromogenes]MCE5005767.1 GNAT family N-acetyltransferase [Staphylococcus chromogenes]MCE5043977.1 GNAT family N-acetyltransferase [Staphylococcus chromogenes]MCE5093309.1 GNAT family N-acetyltransferase [Staphylococcus chromogenes]
MIKNKRFDDITIHLFEEQYRDALYQFKLSERQRIYSSLPKEVLDDALEDPNRVANVVFNEKEEIIGFFVLHQHYQHEGYDTPEEVVYIRSLSINEAYQGHGYGTKIMMNLPEYVQTVFPDFSHLYLVVDAENEAAWNVYERAGFMHTATKEEGPIGKERLYYLDLSSKYVSSLKLKRSDQSDLGPVDIINLTLNQEKVGFLAIEQFQTRLIIRAVLVEDEYRELGIAQNALRQLSTYVRQNYEKIEVLEVMLFGSRNELKPLFQKSNFVETIMTEDYTMFEKYINY